MEEAMGSLVGGRRNAASFVNRPELSRRELLALGGAAAVAGLPRLARAVEPEGQLTWGVHTTLAPTWFDPAETPGFITPYMILYALHDATVKPMPNAPLAPSLAESWSAAEDGLSYAFVRRSGVKFHNGDPVTAEDVKFSFERYRGSSKDLLKDRVAPIGAGPYRFVSSTPGIDVVFEAFDQYWRKTPNVKRLVFKMIPDEATRLAALKAGEVDFVYSIRGELGEELRRTPGLTLKPAVVQAPFYVYFPDQWDPKSSWHDVRVRRAASLAIDRQGINDAITLGYSKITGSTIPETFDFYWQPPLPAYDPANPSSCSLRPDTRAASTPASSTATLRIRMLPRRCSIISSRSASVASCARSSGLLS